MTDLKPSRKTSSVAIILTLISAVLVFLSSIVALNRHQRTEFYPLKKRDGFLSNILEKNKILANFTTSHHFWWQQPTEKMKLSSNTQNTTSTSCKKYFPDTCDMYPYVKFWNAYLEDKDCTESPARMPDASISEQKYVVFEPDRGGVRIVFIFNFSVLLISNPF